MDPMEERVKVHDTSVYLAYRLTDDGRIIGVLPLLLGQAAIAMGRADSLLYTDQWMYTSRHGALLAYIDWDEAATDEPQGWTRHKPSNRRRFYEDGTGALVQEIVRE